MIKRRRSELKQFAVLVFGAEVIAATIGAYDVGRLMGM